MSEFTWLDGSIVGLYLLATMVAGIMVRRYVGTVEDFLVAGREMNVYLGIASLAATEFGIVTCMYTAESGYKYGFAGTFPGFAQFVAMLIVGWTGFCIKPLRDSGVITIPELLEKRFGGGVRWATGVVIVLGGLLNMGVFLRMGGEFLVTVCGLSQIHLGIESLDPFKLEIMMTVLLIGVATYTILGGMLSVLVTDFLQFVVMSAGLLLVTILILARVGWSTLVETVETHHGAGGFNPLANSELGWDYVLFNILLNTAVVLTWQTAIARVLAAKDSATGRKVYTRTSFFFVCRWIIPALWGIAALADFADESRYAAGHAPVSEHVPADGNPGHSGRGHVGRRHVDRFLVHAHLGGRHLQRHPCAFTPPPEVVRKAGAALESRDRRGHRRVPALLRTLVSVERRSLGLSEHYGNDLSGQHLTLLIACCYWPRANSWGAIGAIVFGALIPRRVSRVGAGAGNEGLCQGADRSALVRNRDVRHGGSGHGRRLAAEAAGEEREPGARSHFVMIKHWFWFATTAAVVVWYSSITLYVAVRGAIDIKHMLRNLADIQRRNQNRLNAADGPP